LVGAHVPKVRVQVCEVGMEGVGHDADSPASLITCSLTSTHVCADSGKHPVDNALIPLVIIGGTPPISHSTRRIRTPYRRM